ncbi:uncharacterized protein LOC108949623 isoform X6 [Ciona intestinalis]
MNERNLFITGLRLHNFVSIVSLLPNGTKKRIKSCPILPHPTIYKQQYFYGSSWSSFSSTRRRTVLTTRRRYSPGFSTRRIPFPTTNPATFSTWFSTSRIPFPTIQPSNSSYIKMEDLTPALTAKALTVGYRTNVKPPTSLYKYVVHENLDPDSFNVNGNQLYTAFIMAQYNNIENCLIIPKHERYTSTRCAALFRSRVTDSTIFRLKSEFTATHSYNAPQSISLCCTCCNGSEKMLSGLTIILSVLVSFMLF